jgi:hypothetical protein
VDEIGREPRCAQKILIYGGGSGFRARSAGYNHCPIEYPGGEGQSNGEFCNSTITTEDTEDHREEASA